MESEVLEFEVSVGISASHLVFFVDGPPNSLYLKWAASKLGIGAGDRLRVTLEVIPAQTEES